MTKKVDYMTMEICNLNKLSDDDRTAIINIIHISFIADPRPGETALGLTVLKAF